MDDLDAIKAATHAFAGQLWDAVSEFMEVQTETISPTRTPTTRWDQMSPQTQELFEVLVLEGMLAAPLVQAVGRLVRQNREVRN